MHEFVRKLIHIIVGLGIALMIFVLDHTTVVAILAAGLFLGILCIDLILRGYTLPGISPILSYVDRHDPLPGKGAFYFAVSYLYLCYPFPGTFCCTSNCYMGGA